MKDVTRVTATVIRETGVPNVKILFSHPTPRFRPLHTNVPSIDTYLKTPNSYCNQRNGEGACLNSRIRAMSLLFRV